MALALTGENPVPMVRAGRDGGRVARRAFAPEPMSEGNSQKPDEFADRLRALRDQVRPADSGDGGGRAVPQTAAGWVFRLSIELAVGLLVGGVIGWGLDRLLGTSPAMLIVFFLLGAVAGIYTVIKSAMALNRDPDSDKNR